MILNPRAIAAFVASLVSVGALACAPDPSFGSAGWVVTPAAIGTGGGSTITRDAAGRYVVGGQAVEILWYPEAPPAQFFLTQIGRYGSDGVLDASYGNSGLAASYLRGVPGWAAEEAHVRDVELDPHFGTYLLVDLGPLVVHVRPNGTLDERFGDVEYQFGGALAHCGASPQSGVAMLRGDDGRLVVASRSQDGFYLTRLLADGSRDLAFGSGQGCAHYGSGARSPIAIFDRGASGYEVAGGSAGELFTLRIHLDGTPDPGHGAGGFLTVSTPHGSPVGAVKSSARTVFALHAADLVWPSALVAARVLDDGLLDTAFGEGGFRVVEDVAAPQGGITPLAVADDGRIALFGSGGFQPRLAMLDAGGNITSDCGLGSLARPVEPRSAIFDGDRLLFVGDTWLDAAYATALYALDTTLLFGSSFE